jgi:hypothetical protein
LKIEAEERNLARDRAAVREQFVVGRPGQRRETQQAEVITDRARQAGLAQRLRGLAANARHFNHGSPGVAHRVDRQPQHRLEQADARIADGELRGVHAHRDAARARVTVITREAGLAALVEFSFGGEGEWVRGNDHQNFPSATSKWVGLSRLAPPPAIHAATISISSRELTVGAPISA